MRTHYKNCNNAFSCDIGFWDVRTITRLTLIIFSKMKFFEINMCSFSINSSHIPCFLPTSTPLPRLDLVISLLLYVHILLPQSPSPIFNLSPACPLSSPQPRTTLFEHFVVLATLPFCLKQNTPPIVTGDGSKVPRTPRRTSPFSTEQSFLHTGRILTLPSCVLSIGHLDLSGSFSVPSHVAAPLA